VYDAADKAAADEERAMEMFEQGLKERRRPVNPAELVPIHCLDCGEEVPVARQLAVPHTRRCVRCASDVEIR